MENLFCMKNVPIIGAIIAVLGLFVNDYAKQKRFPLRGKYAFNNIITYIVGFVASFLVLFALSKII